MAESQVHLNAGRAVVEHRTIGPVPPDERHGSGKGLLGIWLGVNMLPLTVVTGALATTLFALPFWWGALAIMVGNAVGGIFMGLHASQGPTLGVPQMLQARGQFGSRGAALVVVVAMVMFMGFFISNLVVGAESLNSVAPSIPTNVGVVIAVFASMAITIVGLRLIMSIITVSAIVMGLLVLASIAVIVVDGIPASTLADGTLSAAGFFSMLAIGAVWQVAYAPYVSDYSRYLPAETGARGAFWGTYCGSLISACLVMSLGALLGVLSSTGDPIDGLQETTGAIATITLLGFALVSMLGNAGNVYCATLNALTIVETFRSGWIPGARGRLVTASALHVLALGVALSATDNFLHDFTTFITVLLYVLIPWSAINLVDYFLVRHGSYQVDDFFRADGGRYGRWNIAALVTYGIGLVVQVPFMVLPVYTGAIATKLHGVDLAWIVGLLVSGVSYYLVARRTDAGTPAPTDPSRSVSTT